MPGGWFFTGGCAVGRIGAGGVTFRVRERNGIQVTVAFPSTTADVPVPFVVGVARPGDVLGRLDGRLAFPYFGSVPCVDANHRPAACTGKGALYLLLINAGNVPATFEATPAIEVKRRAFFDRARQCGIATLVPAGRDGSAGVAWLSRPPYAVPGRDSVLVPAAARHLVYASGGTFTTLALVCR